LILYPGLYYLNKSFIFDQLVGLFFVTIVFLLKFAATDLEEDLSESAEGTGVCENEHTATTITASAEIKIFFMNANSLTRL